MTIKFVIDTKYLVINLNLLVLGKTVSVVCWLFHHDIFASLCLWT